MKARKVKIRLQRVYNADKGIIEVVVVRGKLSPQRFPVAKKDIALCSVVANSMACLYDAYCWTENDVIEFELSVRKIEK